LLSYSNLEHDDFLRTGCVVVPCVGESWQEDNNKPSNE